MSDQNKQKRAFKAKQLFGPQCLNQWIRLRLRTNEGIWFWPIDFNNGWIWAQDYTNYPVGTRTQRLFLPTGRFIEFTPRRYAGNHILGRINTASFVVPSLCPLPTIPTDLTGTWETIVRDARDPLTPLSRVIPLIQDLEDQFGWRLSSNPYSASIPGEGTAEGQITYATFWGNGQIVNQLFLYGQWIRNGDRGRFRWQLFRDEFGRWAFRGTYGLGDFFDGGGTWEGTLVDPIIL